MLTIKNLRVQYTDNQIPVVENLEFSAEEGQITTILGPTGSGKSTILHTIAGVLSNETAAIRGEIELDGRVYSLPHLWKNPVGIAFQKPTFFAWLTAKENVLALHRSIQNNAESIPEIEKLVDHSFNLFGLADAFDKRPHTLSGGMLARLNIIRAISFTPRLLLLDETLANLDEIIRSQILKHLVKFTRDNKLISLMVTHNLNDALQAGGSVRILSGNPLNTAKVWTQNDGSEGGNIQDQYNNLKNECQRLWYQT